MSLVISKCQDDSDNGSVNDVDVTPVMNMFIILIPFLISMAVFTQMSILSFSLPPNVGTGLDNSLGKPKLKITVVVAPEYCVITHGDQMLDSIPYSGIESINESLLKKLQDRRANIDIQDEAIVAVRDAVSFQSMVRVMDACRNAGFVKIGISSATENAEKGV